MWPRNSELRFFPLLGLALALLAAAPARSAPPTESGPARPAAAALLWTEARAALERGDWAAAELRLARLRDRYPATPGIPAAEVRYSLGLARLGLGRPRAALPELRAFVESTRDPADAERGRLELGRALLAVEDFRAAQLVAIELDRAGRASARSLALKARALVGLGRLDDATAALADARIRLPKESPLAVPQVRLAEVRLARARCRAWPTARRLPEATIRTEFERRGACIRAAIPPIAGSSPNAGEETRVEWLAMAEDFALACLSPPEATDLGDEGRPRTALQRRRARAELGDRIRADCALHLAAAREEWGDAHGSTRIPAGLTRLSKRLRATPGSAP